MEGYGVQARSYGELELELHDEDEDEDDDEDDDRAQDPAVAAHPARSLSDAGVAAEERDERGGDGPDEALPRIALLVQRILRSMGAPRIEPRVLHQFLDLCHRFVADVLADAQMLSEHADKPCIDADDLKLALQSVSSFSFSQPPPRETLLELARVRNRTPLPKAISGIGTALPPEHDALLAPNYQLCVPLKSKEQAEDMDVGEENRTHSECMEQRALLSTSHKTGQRKVTFCLVNDKKPHR